MNSAKNVKILSVLIAAFIVFAAANHAFAQAKMEIPETVKVWKLAGKDGNIKSQNTYSEGKGYNLYCQTNSKYLTWEKMPLGINLDYTANSNLKKIHIQTPYGKEREIRSDELVGFAVGGSPAFLRYTHRTIGINLEWKKTRFINGEFSAQTSNSANLSQPVRWLQLSTKKSNRRRILWFT